MEYRMVFDAGSKALKCAIANENNEIIGIDSIIPEIIHSEDGFGRTWESLNYWENILLLTESTIKKAEINSQKIRYITSTSIRPSSIFCDDEFDPLYISASFDIRGIDYGDEIEEKLVELTGKNLYQHTGHFPNLLMIPGRFEWLRNNSQAINNQKIVHYLPIDSWILVKFGGEFHTNYTSAMESGFFDIKNKHWIDEWYSIFEIDETFFPPRVLSGEIIGNVSKSVQERLNLHPDTEIIAGIPDTQAALIAANSITPGNISAVLGTTTPVQAIIEELQFDSEERFWIGGISIKNICDYYLAEVSTGLTGHLIRWASNLFDFSRLSDSDEPTEEQFRNLLKRFDEFDNAEQNQSKETIVSHSVYGNLGPLPLATTSSESLKGEFYFPSPGGVEEHFINQNQLIGAVFDNITFAVSRNIECLRDFTGFNQYFVSTLGGLSRYKLLCQRISDTLNTPIKYIDNYEASLQGLLILCDVASGEVKNITDMEEKLLGQNNIYTLEPRSSMTGKLKQKYKKWLSIINN
jgi:sugar (pentulose or hexulose) kinase